MKERKIDLMIFICLHFLYTHTYTCVYTAQINKGTLKQAGVNPNQSQFSDSSPLNFEATLIVNQCHLLLWKWIRQQVEMRQLARQPSKGMVLQVVTADHFCLHVLCQIFLSLLHFHSTRGILMRCLQPTDVAQVVQLI